MSSGGIQGNQQLSESAHGHIEAANGLLGSLNPTKPELPATDGANHAVDRPKLNLKPRSQATEQLVGSIETERSVVPFGISVTLLTSSFLFIIDEYGEELLNK